MTDHLAHAGTNELLALYRSILGELERRDMIRTENAPAGDCAVRRAVEVPVSVVEELSRYTSHVNGCILHATPAVLDHDLAVDETERLRVAALTG